MKPCVFSLAMAACLIACDTDKRAAAHRLLTQLFKPTFDQIKPTGTGGNEVQDKSGMLGQPSAHRFVCVCAVVIQNQMQLNRVWKFAVQSPKKTEEFLMPMSRITLSNHTTFDYL